MLWRVICGLMRNRPPPPTPGEGSRHRSTAGFYAGVKVGHVEAGLRTHDRWQPLFAMGSGGSLYLKAGWSGD